MKCPQCGEENAIRSHSHYVTREVDFYLCEVCGCEWEPSTLKDEKPFEDT